MCIVENTSPSMHKLVQYFQSLYTCRNEDIYELKGVHIANIEDDLCSSRVEYSSIVYTNVVVNSAVL